MMYTFLRGIYSKLPQTQRRLALDFYRHVVWLPQNITASILKLFLKRKKIEDITKFEQKIYSQNGEDGILQAIFEKIGTTNTFCVEFGVEDGTECNTRYLIEKKGWQFLHMDCAENLPLSIKKEKITAENVNALFKKYNVPNEFDLLSIDIDSNDYWIWKAIQYSPRVVLVEYNAVIPSDQSKTVVYNPNARWDGTDYFGASLLALVKLGNSKGYTLIGCESCGVNAFFVRDELIERNFIAKSIEELYRPFRPGKRLGIKHPGYPRGNKQMISV